MLLAARSLKLGQALRKARRDGVHYLVLDGTLIRTDRVAADRPYFSGKHRVHGMNIQVIASPDGATLWTAGALPGRTHDLSAPRIWGHPEGTGTGRDRCLGGQGLPGCRRSGHHALQGQRQARLSEAGQPITRPPSRSRRTRQRPAQDLAHPAEAPLLPTQGWAPLQSHRSSAELRNRPRMKRGH